MPMNRVAFRRFLRNRPRLKSAAASVFQEYQTLRHSLGKSFPATIRPQHYKLMIAVTARCNARCAGCNYGRDFMPGKQLPLAVVKQALQDAGDAGYQLIRFYGGEPLLHRDLPQMVAACRERGLWPYVTTNGILLGKRMPELFDAGLREVTIGFYGVGESYDSYVGASGLFRKVENSIASVRSKYGNEVDLQLNWLLMRPTCSVEALDQALAFAERYHLRMQIELIHYSLPYFQEGPDRHLQFRPQDRGAIERVVERLLEVKARKPRLIRQTPQTLRSIPDWLLKQREMNTPCTAYDMLWIGADGTVQLCYVTFKLGNLFEKPLREMIGGAAHRTAAQHAFQLRCPHCHCGANDRIMRDRSSRRLYSQPWPSEREQPALIRISEASHV